ncbi:hypothetical protein YC2023_043836 [Brassica napus]
MKMMVLLGRRRQRWIQKIHEVRSNGNRGFLIWCVESVTRSYHSRILENEFVLNVPVVRIVLGWSLVRVSSSVYVYRLKIYKSHGYLELELVSRKKMMSSEKDMLSFITVLFKKKNITVLGLCILLVILIATSAIDHTCNYIIKDCIFQPLLGARLDQRRQQRPRIVMYQTIMNHPDRSMITTFRDRWKKKSHQSPTTKVACCTRQQPRR